LKKQDKKIALLNSLRFKIGEKKEINKLRMTMPGRFFIQRFLKKDSERRLPICDFGSHFRRNQTASPQVFRFQSCGFYKFSHQSILRLMDLLKSTEKQKENFSRQQKKFM